MSEILADTESIDLEQELVELDSEQLVYPCVLLEGVTTEEELVFISKLSSGGADSLPLFLKAFNMTKQIGRFDINIDKMLLLGSIKQYQVTLFIDENTSQEIELNSSESLMKFIRL